MAFNIGTRYTNCLQWLEYINVFLFWLWSKQQGVINHWPWRRIDKNIIFITSMAHSIVIRYNLTNKSNICKHPSFLNIPVLFELQNSWDVSVKNDPCYTNLFMTVRFPRTLLGFSKTLKFKSHLHNHFSLPPILITITSNKPSNK